MTSWSCPGVASLPTSRPPGDSLPLSPSPTDHGPVLTPTSAALRPAAMHRSDSIARLAQTGRSSTLAAPFSSTKPDRDAASKRSHLSLHGHKHHAHHHHHHHHASRSSKYGGEDKEIKSAVLPTTRPPFADIGLVNSADPRPNGSTSGASANDSRDLVSPSAMAEYDHNARHASSRVVKPEDVSRERARQKQREAQLRNALRILDEQSMATTRRLDDTYYSILEKVAGLHGTVGGLQELSTMTRRLRAEFASDADELVDEAVGSLDGIGDFAAQARLLEEFEARIVAGKEKAVRLNERLDTARKRVDERERLEEEWRASVNRRLRIFWGVLAALVAVFLAGYVLYGIRTQSAGEIANGAANETSKHNFSVDLENVVVPPPVREILEKVHSSSQSATTAESQTSNAASDDERLHVFDEL